MRLFVFALLTLGSSTLVMADSQPPSTVNNVQVSALTSNSVRVSWNKPWDDNAVAGYNVYRNGSYHTTVSNTNYLDTGVNSGIRYDYSIVAFDDARNFSQQSLQAGVTPGGSSNVIAAPPAPNGSALAAPSGLRAEVQNGNQAKIFWNAAGGNPEKYNVYRNNEYQTTVSGTDYTDSQMSFGVDYRYQIVAIRDGQFSAKSSELIVNTSNSSTGNTQSSVSVEPVAQAAQPQFDDTSSVPSGYRLVFSDEFQSYSLDTSKWNSSYRWGPNWIINGEKQYYVDRINDPNFGHSPFEFDGEHMTISATRTPDYLRGKANNQEYLSGALTTYNKFKMRYGYVEMRARLPRGKGLWSAFWLLHQNEAEQRPEIDVVEYIGDKPNVAHQTYHYYQNWDLRSTPTLEAWGPDYSQDFHTYAVKWEPGRISWYVDGQVTNTFDSGNVSWEEMYLLVNLAIGGWWAGDPDGSTQFPARMTIDYIRAYQP